MMDALPSRQRRSLLQAAGAAALLAGCGERAQAPLHAFEGIAMGATWRVELHAPDAGAERIAAARSAVAAALSGAEAQMSLYEPTSEISRLNAHASRAPFALSAETFRVFELARSVGEASGGAFDVTVAPAVEAWGFGPDKHRWVPPAEIQRAARARVGWRHLQLDPRTRALVKTMPDAAADFCGIAQGWGVDRAARALDALGFEHYLVDMRSEIRVRGRNARGEPWRIAIEQPDAAAPRPRLLLALSDLSIATSGDYRIYFEQNGRRYCHEIDPGSGVPTRHALASASVVMADCALADAWATALYVLGPERGPALAESLGIAAHFIVRGAGGYQDRSTRAFAALGARAMA